MTNPLKIRQYLNLNKTYAKEQMYDTSMENRATLKPNEASKNRDPTTFTHSLMQIPQYLMMMK